MKDMSCQMPSLDKFQENLFMYHYGKIAVCIYLVAISLMLFLVHYLVSISYWWSLIIIGYFLVFCIIPTKWYFKSIYTYFFSSFFGVFSSVLATYYTFFLYIMVLDLNISIINILIFILIFSITVFLIDFYQSRDRINLYKAFIKKNITKGNTNLFIVENWFNANKEGKFDKSNGLLIYLILLITIPILVIGLFAGNPLVSAKTLFNSGFDKIVNIVITLVVLNTAILLTIILVKEVQKIIAIIQLDD